MISHPSAGDVVGPTRPAPPRDGDRPLAWVAFAAVAAAAAYLLARWVGLGPAPGPWAYWPIHGILVGLLFRREPREWPAIGAAAVASQALTIYLARGDLAGGATLAGAAAGFAQAALSVAILRRARATHAPLEGPRNLAWFVVVAVMLVPLAITPFTALAFSAGLGLRYMAVWGPLFAGNSLSVLLFTPLFLCGAPATRERSGGAGPPETLLCQAAILALALVTFAGPDHWVRFVALPYTLFPLLAWSALRCGPRWTSLAVVVVATVAAWCSARGLGPFGGLELALNQRVLGLQAYLAFVAFTALVLLALTAERLRSFAELSLRESTQVAFFESSVSALMLTDLEGRFLLVNHAAQEAFGRSGETLVGHHPREFLSAEDAAEVESHNRRVLERGEVLMFEETLPRGGRPLRFVVTRFPVRDHTNAIRYIGVIARDDSLQRELTHRLEGAQRVEILGRLAAGAAHDLNNLLTIVVGYTRLLRGRPGRTPEDDTMLREMDNAGAQAAKLSRRLMELGRRRAAPQGRVVVDRVVRELEPLLRLLARGNVDLHLRLGAPDGRVVVEPTAIEQIVLNLVSNSRDAIRGEGRITIATEVVPRDGRPWLRLSVADTGAGMDPATLQRIFEPFYTTKDESRGTGIGLFTVAAIVRQAHGEVTATSEPGAGTTLVVELPAAGGGDVQEEPAEPPAT
ncbi:MAG TPA: ATP-binding protein [Longimicrobiaceae bacterium]|nr:ATP-binding protein [Longimicrobiaceae bacterium]